MWHLSKVIQGKGGVRLIDASPMEFLIWQYRHKQLALLDSNFGTIWERTFEELYEVQNLSEVLVLIQPVNGNSIFTVSKRTGETLSELKGTFYLSSSVKAPTGLLIPYGTGEDVGYCLISPEGHMQKTALPGNLIFRFLHGPYAVTAFYTTIACHRIEDGAEVWVNHITDLQYSTGARVDVPVFITVVKDILVAAFTKHTAAFELATGKLLWENSIGTSTGGLINGDRLILFSGIKSLFHMEIENGQITREASLSLKNDRKMKHITYHNLVEDVLKSNFVQDDTHIYFCLRSACRIVSVSKKTFSVVNSVSIMPDAPGEMFNNMVVLSGNRLFVPFYFDAEEEDAILVYDKVSN